MISFTNAIASPITSTDKVGLVAYPFDLWIWISFVLSLIAFCEGIQKASPIDSHVTPIPWDMPGYDSQVIMAAGTFVSGASIELSADGPMKEPYAVYFQGGLTYPHAKYGIIMSLQRMAEKGLVEIPEIS